ncbi:hypothetical protein I314_06646 [Cryptococcus bacillisporus CA1873]|uniref:Fumarylacetoacetase-like C-terminal domain-containing protein n=1 Tax=Cryptococcus bacillisporus CA1873 TaxID=1296111 RepID=A0ABR5B1N6_CRYGA|nr:hypothetical protein I314_06646 [Cryptococcus bacillisporus CA1873]|eukprot:KIR57507.1 hypothetical protein I314_06646 [Cryptococcus gattii CA1873]
MGCDTPPFTSWCSYGKLGHRGDSGTSSRKRWTSIIGTNQEIYPHPKITQTLDYEGELGIIIRKAGIQISREHAWDYVWGATIINDVTARERRRDHKQFYIGKSLDTFCPMGPYAVHFRQSASTSQLIFDIPTLIVTCSMGITLQPGDVIATGTPAGICLSLGEFLKHIDVIDISISGLGTLSNTVGDPNRPPPACAPLNKKGVVGSNATTKGMRLAGETGPVGS